MLLNWRVKIQFLVAKPNTAFRIFLLNSELHDQHRWLFPLFPSLIYGLFHLVSTHAHMNARTSERTSVLELLISTVSSWPLNFHERMYLISGSFARSPTTGEMSVCDRSSRFFFFFFSCIKRRMDHCEFLFFSYVNYVSSKFLHIFESIPERMGRLKVLHAMVCFANTTRQRSSWD